MSTKHVVSDDDDVIEVGALDSPPRARRAASILPAREAIPDFSTPATTRDAFYKLLMRLIAHVKRCTSGTYEMLCYNNVSQINPAYIRYMEIFNRIRGNPCFGTGMKNPENDKYVFIMNTMDGRLASCGYGHEEWLSSLCTSPYYYNLGLATVVTGALMCGFMVLNQTTIQCSAVASATGIMCMKFGMLMIEANPEFGEHAGLYEGVFHTPAAKQALYNAVVAHAFHCKMMDPPPAVSAKAMQYVIAAAQLERELGLRPLIDLEPPPSRAEEDPVDADSRSINEKGGMRRRRRRQSRRKYMHRRAKYSRRRRSFRRRR